MKDYWTSFIDEYHIELPNKSLAQILEAFFHYAHNAKNRCEEVMYR